MSYFYIFLASLVLSFSGSSIDIPHTEIEKAFNDNDPAAIVSLTKDKLLMKVSGTEGAYSQAQAKLVLKDFFQKNPKGKFGFIFRGKPNDSGSFSIGNYTYKDQTYRITLHFKKIGSSFLIETLNIE